MKCTRCGIFKREEQFSWRNKAKGIRRNDCKMCVANADRMRYEQPDRKIAVRNNAAKRRQDLLDKVWQYKSTHPCVDCGRTNPAGLEFDHLPEFQKIANVSTMVDNGVSWSIIQTEIAKCDVVCGYCHGIRTHARGKWVRNTTIEF